jgi:peptide/nickel transport system substrate-binding protein
VSWTPGVQSLFRRNPDYHQDGPYVNELVLISMSDENARINALLGGQVQAINGVSAANVPTLERNSSVRLLGAGGPGAPSMYMRMDVPPFTDVRVRQAFRLAVDRQLIRNVVIQGRGIVANDLYGRGFPSYNRSLPQRQHDPERARSLLRAAGQEDIRVRLPMRGPTDPLSIAFAQAVREAGIRVDLVPTQAAQYWNPQGVYLTRQAPFYQTGWPVSFEDQATSALITGAPFLGETMWNFPNWTRDFRRAQGIADAQRRNRAYWDLQESLHEQGGYIVPIFRDQIDAHSARLRGVRRNGLYPLGYWTFRTWWFAS